MRFCMKWMNLAEKRVALFREISIVKIDGYSGKKICHIDGFV